MDRGPDLWMEKLIGRLLRTGVMLATALILTGAVLFLARHGGERPGGRTFHGEPGDLTRLSGIVRDAAGMSGRGLIQLGLVLLVATPVARVAFSLFAFTAERDWKFVVITLVVLAVLGYGLVAGGP
ncbi:MAG TPA: DUF1634 domain-containing protein [Anaeromyxobacter sp.]|nr:DUF1634 domain-containing protein [Anaeromyxobacter sp.]